MVDLAFLLLTFFILTTTFNDPHVIPLPMPEKDGPQSPANEKNIVNIVLAGNNEVFWWKGIDGNVAKTNYSHNGLRQLLLDRQRENPNVIVLIKPKDDSRYENLVDLLDEIAITRITRYVIADFTEDDKKQIARSH